MSEMIERARKAVADIPTWDGDTVGHNLTRDEIFDVVRAVILAMREPTEGMVWAGEETFEHGVSLSEIGDAYQAMIDAALEEE